jgi:hypothetical protein
VKIAIAPEFSQTLVGMPRCGVTARRAGGTAKPYALFTRNVARLSRADGVARCLYPSRAISERGIYSAGFPTATTTRGLKSALLNIP